MAIIRGNSCRVKVGDADLRYVRSVTLTTPLDGAVTLTVEFIGGFDYNDGVFTLEAEQPTPTAPPVVEEQPHGRAIGLDGVPTT